jgi:hypothetical protein
MKEKDITIIDRKGVEKNLSATKREFIIGQPSISMTEIWRSKAEGRRHVVQSFYFDD